MWAWPGLLLALGLLHGGGAESEGGGPRCQTPPTWKIGEVEPMKEAMGKVTVVALFQATLTLNTYPLLRMVSLRQKLENQGLRNIEYMVINHQGAQAQRLHPLLAEKLTANVTLYKQPEDQPDVWQILKGEKDDFFIYDRCGRLTQHITLPYSIIGQGHVEKAIRDTYCTRICGDCTYEILVFNYTLIHYPFCPNSESIASKRLVKK
uniref:Selenoprotein P N-terminal domain-containing protein n=1 Tax=Neogobius melanostomus TaxID=47308 RepID=A0A8C6UVT4_9GOBI